MNDRIIPVIILSLNVVLPWFLSTFIPGFSSVLVIGVWSFVSIACLVAVAYWVYEDGKKIEFIEARLWRRIDKLEEFVKMSEINQENLEDKIKKIEAKDE